MPDLYRDPCPTCGRLPGPYLILRGWHVCRCGGHETRYCRDDKGGCGTTWYHPPLQVDTCGEASRT